MLEALEQHRCAMERESQTLLVDAHDCVAKIEERIDEEDARDCTTSKEAQGKAATLGALKDSMTELEKQIAEYEQSRQKFLAADAQSFRAARVFARETYNRFPAKLPVYAERTAVIAALRDDFSVLVLSAETGSGKSTQVVQYLSEEFPGKRILCMQPRRVAAVTLADRVAFELQAREPTRDGPNLVACRSGGGSGSNDKDAKITFVTDFGLLNRLFYQPELNGVAAVVVDEVHERSVHTDLIIALLRRTMRLRSEHGDQPLRIVLTSATMNEGLFARYFARKEWDTASPDDSAWATVMKVGGRSFPVTIHYTTTVTEGRAKKYEKLAEAKAIELRAYRIFSCKNENVCCILPLILHSSPNSNRPYTSTHRHCCA